MSQRDEKIRIVEQSQSVDEEKHEFADYVDSFFQSGNRVEDPEIDSKDFAPTTELHASTTVDNTSTYFTELLSEPKSTESPKLFTNQLNRSINTGDIDMQDNVINAFNDQAKAMYAPMTKFNSLLVESMEKMTEFQLNTIKSYAEIGLSQMKNAVSIQDAEGLRQFTASQAEATSIINKKILEDAKAMSDMAADFRTKIEDVMAQSRQAVEKPVAAAAKKAN
jgi:phasin family protein